MTNPRPLVGARVLFLLLLALSAGASRGRGAAVRESTDRLNVHIVCHSHDDAGWLKTVDQYYYGANNTIQVAGVQYILDTVMQALAANPERKFIYGEMSFFMRWWAQQDEGMRALVTQLVDSGQLEFVNGGYVQHDEAATHYVAMVDQTSLGHRFLRRAFGAGGVPTVGWQVDPFGHSSTQAGLLAAHLGFDGLFFGRADYQDMEHRLNLTAMELLWRGSASLEDASVFTGNFISGNYGPPEGFAFEWACPPIMDDPRLDEYNVQDRVDAFVEQCRRIASATRGTDIMLTIGSDFQYTNAHLQYKNLDKLIAHVNADGRLNAFYSTPAAYVRAKHAYNATWPTKQDDFFPYADFPHAYWTGYFTSRPASKGYIRAATSYLQAARQLEAFMGLPSGGAGPTTHALEEAVSLTQHHDAITGTEKQHVACDYHRRLHRALKQAQAVVTTALEALIRGQYGPGSWRGSRQLPGAGTMLAGGAQESGEAAAQRRLLASAQAGVQANPVDAPIELEVCDWLNATACNTSVSLSSAGRGLMVAAYNPLGWSRQAPLRVPLSTNHTCGWRVTGPEGEEVPSQLVPAAASTRDLQRLLAQVNATSADTFGDAELVFVARLPPLGYSTFFVQPAPDCSQPLPTAARGGSTVTGGKDRYASLDNGIVSLEFDTHTGLLHGLTAEGVTTQLSLWFSWYNSSDGLEATENRGQASGAYIFRPNGLYNVSGGGGSGGSAAGWWRRPLALLGGGGNAAAEVRLELVHGGEVWEARQAFAGWATLITRLYRGQRHVELEWTVGPIPFEDGLGREVVLVYSSDVDSGDEFFTDANGREMVKRVRDFRPSWNLNVTEAAAGNYYPLTAAMHIQDGSRQLALLTDRAQGGASLRSGQVEVMLHRRTLADDDRGVGEPLNETMCGCTACDCPGLVARGLHWLLLAPADEAAKPRRTLQQQLNDPPLLAFSAIPREIGSSVSGGGQVGLRRTFSLSEGHILHSNVHLLTLQDLGRSFLVRLAHLYPEGEDPVLSHPITENLNAVLQLLQYREVRELSLSANQLRSEMESRRLRFAPGDSLTNSSWLDAGGGPGGAGQLRSASEMRGRADLPAKIEAAELQRLRAGAEIIDCRVGCSNGELLVTLKPMEVRTFELVYRPY